MKMFVRHHRQPTAVLILKKTEIFASSFFNITPVIKQNRFEKNPKRGASKLPKVSPSYSCDSLISKTPLNKEFFWFWYLLDTTVNRRQCLY